MKAHPHISLILFFSIMEYHLGPKKRGTMNKLTRYILSLILMLSSCMQGNYMENSTSVTVVGAGPGGLLAAYRLKQAGLNVTVCEARSRVGGRLFSWPERMIEFGAWSLGDGGNIDFIESLAQEIGLEVYVAKMPFPGYMLKETGKHPFVDMSDDFKRVVGNEPELVRTQLAELIDSSSTLQDVLAVFFKDHPELRKYGETMAWVYHGSPASMISANFYKESIIELCLGGVSDLYTHSEAFFPLHRIKGGNDLIVKKLAQALGNSITCDKPLKSIRKGQSHAYALTFADGTTKETDIVILALPVSAYHTITFKDGSIPQDQLERIKKTCPGTVSKILVPARGTYPTGFFIGDGYSAGITEDEKYLTIHWARPLDLGLCTEKITQLCKQLDWPVPADLIRIDDNHLGHYPPDAALIIDWPHSRYTQGSYCAYSPSQAPYLHYEEIEGITVNSLFRPSGNIYFVGEAASVHAASGSVGAALESAQRITTLILKRAQQSSL